MSNALNSKMLRNPESINWGLNEVALVKVVDDRLQIYEHSPVPLTHLAFLWEGERRIDVIFSELESPSLEALA